MADKKHTNHQAEQEKDFLERPSTLRILWGILWAVCGLTLVPELFLSRSAHFGVDGMYGFYALLGFVSCALLIIVSKLAGHFLKRDEDYYNRE